MDTSEPVTAADRPPGGPRTSVFVGSQLRALIRRPVVSGLLDIAGMFLSFVGLRLTLSHLDAPVNVYDEGLLLTDAFLVGIGKVPYRDFYSNYPPGIFLALAGLWQLFGTSVLVARYLGVLLHVLAAAGAAVLAGGLSGRRFSLATFGLATIWLSVLGAIPFAWIAALAAALWAVVAALGAQRRPTAGRLFITGAALGAVGALRHDLFIYLVLSLGAAGLSALFLRRSLLRWTWIRPLGWVVLGALLPLLVVWLPVLIRSGLAQAAQDLYFDQVRYVLPARTLPAPAVLNLGPANPFPFPLPAALRHWYPGAFVLTSAGPLLAALAWVLVRRGKLHASAPAVGLGCLALAVLPQMLGRTDEAHCLFTVAPALALGGGIAEGLALYAAARWVHVLAGLGTLVALSLPIRELVKPFSEDHRLEIPGGRGLLAGLPPEDARLMAALVAELDRRSPTGAPLFVGNIQHRLITINNVSLYYFAQRPGATRYLQFDPGVTTREDVQRTLIDQLEATKPKVAVLMLGGYVPESNESSRAGSGLLDAYLRQRYRPVATIAHYVLLERQAPR